MWCCKQGDDLKPGNRTSAKPPSDTAMQTSDNVWSATDEEGPIDVYSVEKLYVTERWFIIMLRYLLFLSLRDNPKNLFFQQENDRSSFLFPEPQY